MPREPKCSALPKPKTRIRPRTRAKRCWELSARIQLDDPTWTLVHGRIAPLADRPEITNQHAWLERDGIVYDATNDTSYTKADYVGQFGAIEQMCYTVLDAALAMRKSGFYEQWHDPDDLIYWERKKAEAGL